VSLCAFGVDWRRSRRTLHQSIKGTKKMIPPDINSFSLFTRNETAPYSIIPVGGRQGVLPSEHGGLGETTFGLFACLVHMWCNHEIYIALIFLFTLRGYIVCRLRNQLLFTNDSLFQSLMINLFLLHHSFATSHYAQGYGNVANGSPLPPPRICLVPLAKNETLSLRHPKRGNSVTA
jgi:hypothetical protein